MQLEKSTLTAISEHLLKYDPDIVEIIQFGSSVYSPKLARDLDLLVFTKKRKDYMGYVDKILELDLPHDVDIIVNQVGETLRNKHVIISAFASHVLLYGDGSYLKEVFSHFDPKMEDAYEALRSAENHIRDAPNQTTEGLKDRYVRLAFNELFDAARIASMAYLSTEQTKWGRIRSRLPKLYRIKFEEFIRKLHVDYFYQGNYPRAYAEEFKNWYREAKLYIKQLEANLKKKIKK